MNNGQDHELDLAVACFIDLKQVRQIKPLSLPPRFQNQFFISCSDQKNVLNTIGDAIVKRILRAHRFVTSLKIIQAK